MNFRIYSFSNNYFGRLRVIPYLLILIGIFSLLNASAQTSYPFQNADLDMETRVDDLLSRMTLEEKVSALSTDPSVPRLGIKGAPHIEGYHGVAMGGPANWAPKGDERVPTTQFPQAYGMGATWNPELIRKAGEIESIEARYIFQNPEISKGGLVVRAPNADLGRDPRWGRTEEVLGEDPFLVGTLSTAFTKGLQGDDEKYWRTASLLKHFLANSNENTRDSSSSNFDTQLFYEYYGATFRRAILEGGSNAYMTAYNAVNGVPAHIHPMHKEISMARWGVNGIICTDGGGYTLLVRAHKAYDDYYRAAEGVIKAGLNQFLDNYREGVWGALAHGYLAEEDLDEVLKGVYRVMIKLGQLDPQDKVPYASIGRDGKPAPWTSPEHQEAALQMARESVVLLKNEKQTLPLAGDELGKVAVIGHLADTILLDWYSGMPPFMSTPLDGSKKRWVLIRFCLHPITITMLLSRPLHRPMWRLSFWATIRIATVSVGEIVLIPVWGVKLWIVRHFVLPTSGWHNGSLKPIPIPFWFCKVVFPMASTGRRKIYLPLYISPTTDNPPVLRWRMYCLAITIPEENLLKHGLNLRSSFRI